MGRVALVSMPFASTKRPSLQLGVLKGLAKGVGWDAQTFHVGLDFAALIGRERYELLCQHRGMQLSDWIFSSAAFGSAAPDPSAQILRELPGEYRNALADMVVGDVDEWLLRVRDVLAPAFVESVRASLDAYSPDIVGLTSTFQQNVASFALARSLREHGSQAIRLFGGANFDDVMGLEFVRALECIDYAAIGEGDQSFPAFLEAISRNTDPGSVPGIASRRSDGTVRYTPIAAPFAALDTLPFPDYDEYFDRLQRIGAPLPSNAQIDLPIEGSRGCWWGSKHHCVFCGLNAGTMAFRAKTPERFLAEIVSLSARYHSFHIEAVDNIIDMNLFKSLLPEMAGLRSSWNFFFEVKSNLRPDQLALLNQAGVRRVQPGIESLSTPVLKLMRKGVSAIQNVNFLRWCAAYDIRPSWNFLWGFPGELKDHYYEQEVLIPKLAHLQPPDGQGRLWLERFSPLFFQREELGVKAVRPASSYAFVYPSEVDLEKAAYFFDYELSTHIEESFFSHITSLLNVWRTKHKSHATLDALSAPGFVRIMDTRFAERPMTYELEGDVADVYRAFFQSPTTAKQQAELLNLPVARVERAIDDFMSADLMMADTDKMLALAVPGRTL